MWFLRQIFSPFQYLSIQIGSGCLESKKFIDFGAPALLAIALYYIHQHVIGAPDFFGAARFVSSFGKFFELLAAFFIAALAAVASIDREFLDGPLRGSPATIKRWSNKSSSMVEVAVTRRQFVCHLFGYLSATTIIVVLVLPFCEAYVANGISKFGSFEPFISAMARYLFFFVLSNVIVISLYGIYFLSDRLQNEDSD